MIVELTYTHTHLYLCVTQEDQAIADGREPPPTYGNVVDSDPNPPVPPRQRSGNPPTPTQQGPPIPPRQPK